MLRERRVPPPGVAGGDGECGAHDKGWVSSETPEKLTTDVFLLNHFPCKFVELVGWVAGVDHKETSMTITRAPFRRLR